MQLSFSSTMLQSHISLGRGAIIVAEKPLDSSSNKFTEVTYTLPRRNVNQEDEMHLSLLISNIWKQKLLIILITIIVTALGASYSFLSAPTYESKTYLLPPTNKNINELKKLASYTHLISDTNTTISVNTDYSTQYVYSKFIQVLKSNQAKHSFFQQPKIKQHYGNQLQSESKAWERFLTDLTVKPPKKGKSETIVTFRAKSAQDSAQILNSYIKHAISITKNQLLMDYIEEIDTQKEQINNQISSLSNLYTSEIKKELAKLHEALGIAKSIELSLPLDITSINIEKNGMMIDEVRRLYKLGSNALQAEINALQNRKESELFIPGLSNLLQQQSVLNSLSIDINKIQPARIDLPAYVPEKSLKPQKVLVLATSLILGMLLGIFLALIRISITNNY